MRTKATGSRGKTRIVATLGPATDSEAAIIRLAEAGVNVFRLNFSHGTHDEHLERINTINKLREAGRVSVAILVDLQGPKIRTRKTKDDQTVLLREGTTVSVTTRPVLCDETTISVDYSKLVDEVEVGQELLINDGAVRLAVIGVWPEEKSMECKVLNDGEYASRKGVNIPYSTLSIPSLTAKDRKDLAFILQQDIDYIALSFVRRGSDVKALRRAVSRSGKQMKIIAKVENPEATENIEEIIHACDGVMVARGDLGVETSAAEIPILQKRIIEETNRKGKLVIVATQMLESMIKSPSPTRAEATDVANAIFDGTDAVMLSAETSIGKYPVHSVETMRHIADLAEQSSYYNKEIIDLDLAPSYAPYAICEAAAWASRDMGDIPIIVFTTSGATAFYLSNIRPQAPLLACSPDKRVVHQLSLACNVRAVHVLFQDQVVGLITAAEKVLMKAGLLSKGQKVVIISGTTPARGATNFLRIKTVGQD